MNDELEKTERLFQQLGGNTPEEDLNHLKVCFEGDSKHGLKIIQELMNLDGRVRNLENYNGYSISVYYFVDVSNFKIDLQDNIPTGYKLLDIEDYFDGPEPYYCPMCEEEIDSFSETAYYSDGDECCQSCYDESCDDLEDADDEEYNTTYTPQVSDLEIAENTFRLLSETQSTPKEVIESKLSELSSIPRRRRK